jgi:hypothetical protein
MIKHKRGTTKCQEKNREIVATETDSPPQRSERSSLPSSGIAETRFVITTSAQYAIFDTGKQYPENATKKNRKRSSSPEFQELE